MGKNKNLKQLTSIINQTGGYLSSGYHINRNLANLKLKHSNYLSGFNSPKLMGGAIRSGSEVRTFNGSGGAIRSGTESRIFNGTKRVKTNYRGGSMKHSRKSKSKRYISKKKYVK